MPEESGGESDDGAGDSGFGPSDERSAANALDHRSHDGASPVEGAESEAPSNDESTDTGGNVAGEFLPEGPIEPGTPRLENALFVTAGGYVAILGITRMFLGGGGYTISNLAIVTVTMGLVAVVLLGFFGVLTPDT